MRLTTTNAKGVFATRNETDSGKKCFEANSPSAQAVEQTAQDLRSAFRVLVGRGRPKPWWFSDGDVLSRGGTLLFPLSLLL